MRRFLAVLDGGGAVSAAMSQTAPPSRRVWRAPAMPSEHEGCAAAAFWFGSSIYQRGESSKREAPAADQQEQQP